jgi:8-hydroxy-5-deazaflavin:NADPH oxidoreductase
MNVTIIGSGNVGRALATSISHAGHQVTLTAGDAKHAESAAAKTGVSWAASNAEAVAGADVVILAVPTPALDEVLNDLASSVDGKVLIDATNPMSPDFLPPTGRSAAEKIQSLLSKAHVVKAFNTAFASRQAKPEVDGEPTDGFVAGDNEAAKSTVLGLVGDVGFRPVDAGPLSMAHSLEAMALLGISLQIRNGGTWQSGWRIVEPTARAA